MKDKGIIIIGAGFSGLSCSYHLAQSGISSTIYEKMSYPYGRSAAFEKGGYIFDQGPHESFTKEEYIIELFNKSIEGNFKTIISDVSNYWEGYWLRHPAQVNLYNLPSDIKANCIESFIEWQNRSPKILNNYKDWCNFQLGEYFANHFTDKYTRKYWTAEPEDMTIDWVGKRLYPPKIKEMLLGSYEEQKSNLHYITSARYPSYGGYGSFGKILLNNSNILYSKEIKSINLKKKYIVVNGEKIYYEKLVNSMPLPEFIKILEESNQEMLNSASELSPAHFVIVTIGTKENIKVPYNWFYFYDEDIIFSRVHQPHLFSEYNSPKDRFSLQCEIYFSKYKKHPGQNIYELVINQLIKTKVISDINQIEMIDEREILYGNIIFDKYREKALNKLYSFLNKYDVTLIGRYGEWQYYWSDQSVLSGKKAAEKLI